jgi:hypothetical protein
VADRQCLGRKIGKIGAMAGNGDGFVANREYTLGMVRFVSLMRS